MTCIGFMLGGREQLLRGALFLLPLASSLRGLRVMCRHPSWNLNRQNSFSADQHARRKRTQWRRFVCELSPGRFLVIHIKGACVLLAASYIHKCQGGSLSLPVERSGINSQQVAFQSCVHRPQPCMLHADPTRSHRVTSSGSGGVSAAQGAR